MSNGSGNRAPWMVTASYKHDRQELQGGAVTEEMVFAKAAAAVPLLEAAE